uniref:Uncharacterized protein n=1 Tax=Glossina pallidipes TaxID=7398 RepID=A0A1A9ZIF5_GLOPL
MVNAVMDAIAVDRVCFIMSLGFKFTIKRLFLNAFKIGTSVGAPQQPLHHNQPRRSLCIQRYTFTSERVTWQRYKQKKKKKTMKTFDLSPAENKANIIYQRLQSSVEDIEKKDSENLQFLNAWKTNAASEFLALEKSNETLQEQYAQDLKFLDQIKLEHGFSDQNIERRSILKPDIVPGELGLVSRDEYAEERHTKNLKSQSKRLTPKKRVSIAPETEEQLDQKLAKELEKIASIDVTTLKDREQLLKNVQALEFQHTQNIDKLEVNIFKTMNQRRNNKERNMKRIKELTSNLDKLLSSLATDLDMMLNDLRSSPSSRLGATSTSSQHHHHHHQPHHHSQPTATYTPLSLGIGTSSNIAGINRNSQTTQPNYSNYSQSSSTLCDYRSYQQQCEYTYHSRQDIAEKKQQQNQYVVDQQQQKQQQEQQQLNRSVEQVQQNHYELQFNQKICTDANQSNDTNNNNHNGSSGSCELNRINNGNVITTGRLGIQHTQPINALESNINISRSSCCSSPSKSLSTLTSSSSSSSSSFQTFSTDVTRISRLPLYTYQRKQLQQPQTLHIKLLPQQQALKALTSQITAKENVVKHTPSVCAATTTNICNNISSTSFQTTTTTTITTALANPSFIPSSSTDFRIKSISASTSSSSLVSLSSPPSKSCNRLYKFRNSGTSNASSWLPSSSNFLRRVNRLIDRENPVRFH